MQHRGWKYLLAVVRLRRSLTGRRNESIGCIVGRGGRIAVVWLRIQLTWGWHLWIFLHGHRFGPDQGVFYRPYRLLREDWHGVHRSGDRLFPSLEHSVHTFPGIRIDQGVGLHEGVVEIPAEIDGVWRPDVFDDAVKQIQCW